MSENNDWLHTIAPGDKVWWNDPEHGVGSGYYKIAEKPELYDMDFMDPVFTLQDKAGSEIEVFASELSETCPNGLYPVVDGESGSVDVYGYASSKEEAIDVGNATFTCDEVVDAYLAKKVVLHDGTAVSKAWVACTHSLS